MGKRMLDSSAGTEMSGVDMRRAWDWRRFRLWAVVTLVLPAGGVVGTVFAASSVARADADKSRQAFTSASGAVASTLQLAVQREQDLVVSAAGFFLGKPAATTTEFRAWSRSVQALQRFPELDGWGEVVIVPASGLAAYEASALKDPATALGPDGQFHVIPAGNRPYYCFDRAGQERSAQLGAPPGFDFCAGQGGTVTSALATRAAACTRCSTSAAETSSV